MRAWYHHGSDTPTSPRAILHHTDPNPPNISGGSVSAIAQFSVFQVKMLSALVVKIRQIVSCKRFSWKSKSRYRGPHQVKKLTGSISKERKFKNTKKKLNSVYLRPRRFLAVT